MAVLHEQCEWSDSPWGASSSLRETGGQTRIGRSGVTARGTGNLTSSSNTFESHLTFRGVEGNFGSSPEDKCVSKDGNKSKKTNDYVRGVWHPPPAHESTWGRLGFPRETG